MDSEFYVRRGELIKGPLTLRQLRDAVRQKKLLTADEIASSPDGPWNRVATVYRDVIDGRTPRFLSDRKSGPSRPATVDTRDDAPSLTEQLKQPLGDPDFVQSLDEAVELSQDIPSLPPPLKHELTLRKQKPQTSTKRSSPKTALLVCGRIAIGVVIVMFAIVVVLNRPQAIINTLVNEEGGTDQAITLKKQLKKLQRTLRLNKNEQDQLKASIDSIESKLRTKEAISRTVFQQQVGRIDACIEMTAIVAQALGAKPSDTEDVISKKSQQDIFADTVFQQLAGHLSLYLEMIELAAQNAGASPDEVSSCHRQFKISESTTRTAQQQIAARIDAVQAMTKLLARALGASKDQLAEISSSASMNDALSDTVFQQMSARQKGVVKLLGEAALAQGAGASDVNSILSGMRSADVIVDTVQQQFSARIMSSFEMTSILAKSIIVK